MQQKSRNTSTGYTLTLSLKLALRTWKLNGVVFVSFFLAMTVVACCSALIDNWVGTQESHYAAVDLNTVSCCNFTGTPLKPAEILQIQKSLGTKTIAVTSQVETIQTPEAGEIDVKAISGTIDQVFKVEVSQGRFFTQEELSAKAPVCVVGKVAADAAGLCVGDVLTLRGLPCEVVGFASLDANKLDVLLPMGTYFSGRQNIQQQQMMYCITGQYLQDSDYEIAFLKAEKSVDVHTVTTAQEIQMSLQKYILQSIQTYCAAAIVAFLFSLINIFLIIKGKFDTKQYLYAVLRALGAKNRQVFFQILGENLLMALAAAGAALLVLPLALRFFGFTLFYYRLFVVAAIVVGLALLTSAAASVFLFWSTLRLSLVDVLQREASKT